MAVEEALRLDSDRWIMARHLAADRNLASQATWKNYNSTVLVSAKIDSDERGFHVFAKFWITGIRMGVPDDRHFSIGLVSSPSNLGQGERWFWICPRCYRRRKHLYVRPDAFEPRCRVCYRLGYLSDHENPLRAPGGSNRLSAALYRLRIDGYLENKEWKAAESQSRRLEYRREKYRVCRTGDD